MKKRIYSMALVLVMVVALSFGCIKEEVDDDKLKITIPPQTDSQPFVTPTNIPDMLMETYSNLVSKEEQAEVKAILSKASLANVDVFFEWVGDFNACMDKKAGLTKGWCPIAQIDYKSDEISTAWDEAHEGKTDSNCRINAFLLLQDMIQSKSFTEYGSYLMMDVDEIEKNEMYSVIKDDLGKFIALFDQVSVKKAKKDSDYLSAFPKAWKERGVVFPTGNVSIVNVVMNDPDSKELFIGHTGVLIEENGYLLFVEKLAPAMPYQVTRYSSREELSKTLLARPDYTRGDEDFPTFLLENDKAL